MKDKRDIIRILHSNKPRLLVRYHLKSIGVFGSFTRDDFNENSDIDILIEYEKPLGIEFIDLADDLEEMLNRKVDLVSRNGVKPKYLEEIKKDLIYV